MPPTSPSHPARACLICGSADELTVEHIVPQTLWKRFGMDPDHQRLARYRTTLCRAHNAATSHLHQRTEVIDLLEKGEPVTKRSLALLADWAAWVTLLLGLSTGEGVLPNDETRRLLNDRFDGRKGGLPRGLRVYIARVSEYVSDTNYVSHMVGLEKDGRIAVNHSGTPVGFNGQTGPIAASEGIGLGKIAILVLSRTYSSGPDHDALLDSAALTIGMERIHPLTRVVPALPPRPVDITAVSRVFMPILHGSDTSLLPKGVRIAVNMLMPPSMKPRGRDCPRSG